MAAALWRSLARRKPLPGPLPHADRTLPASLARVLTSWDLTALGVGSTLGVGIYVLAGDVARRQAGPAVLLSFVVAGIASGLAGLCYAEFGARVPLAGSAYIYSYVSVGELLAFVIGWSLVLEYAIGSASVARALTSYIDQLTGHIFERTFEKLLPMNVPILASYADPVSFAVAFGLAVILAFGVRESLSLNNIFAGLNMAVIIFVIVAGALKADPKNWRLSPKDAPKGAHVGSGGFMPFGISGVLRGAATCFYGFIGFDCIAATGEEVRRPHKAIPVAILGSLLIVCLSYLAVSAVITLMWPYYALKDDGAPLAYVFHQVGWPIAQWVVAIGGIFGLVTSLFGTMFPLPRVIYAMATDGLIFRFLGNVNSRFQTPFVGTLVSGFLTGIMAAVFHLQQLVDMLSIGTLMAYTLVATCVLLLRYRASEDDETSGLLNEQSNVKTTMWGVIKQLFNSQGLRSPTNLTTRMVSVFIVLYCVFSVIFAVLLVHDQHGIIPLGTVASIMTLLLIFISLQPCITKSIPFKVPLVPILPALSISMNIYLMLLLDRSTWIRFGVWMVIGCLLWIVYIAYRWFLPEIKFKECYENAGFNNEEVLANGSVCYDVTDASSGFVVVDNIPLEKIEGQNGQVLKETCVDAPETAQRRVNRFVRPTSVIQGVMSLESVSELSVKGELQSGKQKNGCLHRPSSVQEGRVSLEYALESDVLSIDSDAHSLYPEVFILPTEEEIQPQKVIEEEKDEREDAESLADSSQETSKAADVLNEDHVANESRSQSTTDCLRSRRPAERKYLPRNGSFSESDDGTQSVFIPTKPDSDQVIELPQDDEELSHTAETVAPECSTDSQEFASETERGLLSNGSEYLKKYAGEKESAVHARELRPPTPDEDDKPLKNSKRVGETEPFAHLVNVIDSSRQNIPAKLNKSALPNFSISSFDSKPIDIEKDRKKYRPPSLENAMAAGGFSDSSFVKRLNDVIGQIRSVSKSPGLPREQNFNKPEEEADNDRDDDVFVSPEDVPCKKEIRERLESLLSNGPSTIYTRFDPVMPRQNVAKDQPQSREVKDQNPFKTGGEEDSHLKSLFIDKLDAITKRQGSLPLKKKKDKEQLLLGGHTLPERRTSKDGLNGSGDVPSKAEIRRTLETLFMNPTRRVTPGEEMSTEL